MRLLAWISQLFRTAPSGPVQAASVPLPEPVPADPEAETAVLADAHRKDTLRRMREAIFHDAHREEFGVRLSDGRVLYRPTHSEAIALWYAEDARAPAAREREQARKPAARKGPERHQRPIEAVDLTTGEVRHHFSNVDAIRAAGFNAKCVSDVLAGRQRTHRGLSWRDAMPAPHVLRTSPNKSAAAWALVAGLPQHAVESFNQATGEVHTVYRDPAAVIAAGFLDALPVLDGQTHQAYGLGWRFQPEQGRQPPTIRCAKACRPLRATDPRTGRVVKEFPSVTHAIYAGYSTSLYVSLQTGRPYKGLIWSYVDPRSRDHETSIGRVTSC
jgi:hypothetical protein